MRGLLFLIVCGVAGAQAPVGLIKSKTVDGTWIKPAIQAGKSSPSHGASPANPVVVTAGSMTITKSEFEALLKHLPDSVRREIGGDERQVPRHFAEQLGAMAVYADEARRLKLDSRPAAKVELMFQEQSLLAGLLYEHILETNKPTEEACKVWFAAHQADYEQVKARQILIRFGGSPVPVKPNLPELSEEAALARAQAIRVRIVKGEDFAALAQAESDDPASSSKSGDLGMLSHGRLVPLLDNVAFTLPIGDVSQPLKSQYGWHLIQVQDRSVQSFTAAKTEIEKRLQTQNAQKALEAFKRSAKLVLDETYFGKPAISQLPPTPQAGGAVR